MNRNPSSRGSILYIIGISLIAALGGFLFGFDMTVVSGTVPFLKYFFHLDAAGLGWAVSSCILACVFGAAAAGKLADAFGRKNVLIVTAVFLCRIRRRGGLGVDLQRLRLLPPVGWVGDRSSVRGSTDLRGGNCAHALPRSLRLLLSTGDRGRTVGFVRFQLLPAGPRR